MIAKWLNDGFRCSVSSIQPEQGGAVIPFGPRLRLISKACIVVRLSRWQIHRGIRVDLELGGFSDSFGDRC